MDAELLVLTAHRRSARVDELAIPSGGSGNLSRVLRRVRRVGAGRTIREAELDIGAVGLLNRVRPGTAEISRPAKRGEVHLIA